MKTNEEIVKDYKKGEFRPVSQMMLTLSKKNTTLVNIGDNILQLFALRMGYHGGAQVSVTLFERKVNVQGSGTKSKPEGKKDTKAGRDTNPAQPVRDEDKHEDGSKVESGSKSSNNDIPME